MIVPFCPLPRRAALALVAAGALMACATPPEKPLPVNKTLVVEAGPRINEYNNSANPIVLRLYQLSSRSEIEAAGFWDIFNEADERLAGAIIDRVSLSPLYPGERRLVAIDLEPDTLYLGAFAEFADYEAQQYLDAIPIDAETLDRGITVAIGTSGVALRYRDTRGETVDAPPPKPGLFKRVKTMLFGGEA